MTKFLVFSFFMTSCGLFQTKQPPKLEYFEKTDVSASVEDMEANLMKSSTNAGKRYEVKVIPLTKALYNKKDLKTFELPNSKVCFEINLTVATVEEEVLKSFWTAKVIDAKDKTAELEWFERDKNLPKLNFRPGAYGPKKHWSQTGIMCSKSEFDFKQNFKMLLSSKDVAFPFSKTMEFKWDVVKYEKVGDKEVPAKTIYKKQPWRGW